MARFELGIMVSLFPIFLTVLFVISMAGKNDHLTLEQAG